MKRMLMDAVVLFMITIVAGLLLGGAYQITREPIARAEEAAATEAYKKVFPDAAEFKPLELTDPVNQNAWDAVGFAGVTLDQVLCAADQSGNLLGYVMMLTSHEGYGGNISFAMGIQNDGTVNGISILTITETAGLGMKAEKLLQPQFAAKKVSSFSYTKTSAATDNQIDAISGATITTNALVNAVNAGIYCFQTQLRGDGQ